MSDARIQPRIEFEDRPAPRLEAPVLPALEAAPPPRGGLGALGAGVAVLVVGLALIQLGTFVADQFERGAAVGWITVAIVGAGLGLIGLAIWRELHGLLALRNVDRLRRELHDPATAQAAAQRWVAGLAEGASIATSLAAVTEPDAVVALLRAGPIAALQSRADALGRRAALQIFAATAALPSPAFDGLLVAWRGVRLVREVAALHGVRPGALATLSLLRRTAAAAATVMATDLAMDAVTRALISNPLLQHLAGDVAGAGVAARRMMVLARAASAACEPLGAGA